MSKQPLTRNFGLLPPEISSWEGSKVAVISVPFEMSTSYGKGAGGGPNAIIEASTNMELYDMQFHYEPCRIGIHTFHPPAYGEIDTPEKMIRYAAKKTGKAVESGKLPVIVGGEHTVSLAPVTYFTKKYSDLTVLSLDAHTDLRDAYEGNIYSHASVIRRIIDLCPVVEAGIRSTASEEQAIITERNVKIFPAEDIIRDKGCINCIVSNLSENVYLSIDIDALDPSIMPSTGTPEPGGLGWYDILDLVHSVVENRNIVGFDVVELAPVAGNPGPDFLAAKLIYKIIGMLFHKKYQSG